MTAPEEGGQTSGIAQNPKAIGPSYNYDLSVLPHDQEARGEDFGSVSVGGRGTRWLIADSLRQAADMLDIGRPEFPGEPRPAAALRSPAPGVRGEDRQDEEVHEVRLRVVDADLRKQLAALIWWEFGWVGVDDDERVRDASYRAADAILTDRAASPSPSAGGDEAKLATVDNQRGAGRTCAVCSSLLGNTAAQTRDEALTCSARCAQDHDLRMVLVRFGIDNPAEDVVSGRGGAVMGVSASGSDLPGPSSSDGAWTCWRSEQFGGRGGWVVLRNPGGITVHASSNLTGQEARQMSSALVAAAVWDEAARGDGEVR